MNKITSSDIDFSKLELKKDLGRINNNFYVDQDNNTIYKFFSNMPYEKGEKVIKKLEKYGEMDKPYIPKIKDIIYDDRMVGYSEEYIKGDTLYKTLSEKGLLKEIKCVLKLSKYLEDLHKNNVLVSDFHFNNIMVDENDEPFFVDVDSYQVDNIESFGTSILLNNYYAQKGKNVERSINSDRIAMYLAIFDKLFGRDFYCIKNEAYNSYLSSFPLLSELYPIYLGLSYRGQNVPVVPYLHKVIKNYDNS